MLRRFCRVSFVPTQTTHTHAVWGCQNNPMLNDLELDTQSHCESAQRTAHNTCECEHKTVANSFQGWSYAQVSASVEVSGFRCRAKMGILLRIWTNYYSRLYGILHSSLPPDTHTYTHIICSCMALTRVAIIHCSIHFRLFAHR